MEELEEETRSGMSCREDARLTSTELGTQSFPGICLMVTFSVLTVVVTVLVLVVEILGVVVEIEGIAELRHCCEGFAEGLAGVAVLGEVVCGYTVTCWEKLRVLVTGGLVLCGSTGDNFGASKELDLAWAKPEPGSDFFSIFGEQTTISFICLRVLNLGEEEGETLVLTLMIETLEPGGFAVKELLLVGVVTVGEVVVAVLQELDLATLAGKLLPLLWDDSGVCDLLRGLGAVGGLVEGEFSELLLLRWGVKGA